MAASAGWAWGGEPADKLDLRLRDVHGRLVQDKDFRGRPVLILSGACW
jgi:hypothetical protein